MPSDNQNNFWGQSHPLHLLFLSVFKSMTKWSKNLFLCTSLFYISSGANIKISSEAREI